MAQPPARFQERAVDLDEESEDPEAEREEGTLLTAQDESPGDDADDLLGGGGGAAVAETEAEGETDAAAQEDEGPKMASGADLEMLNRMFGEAKGDEKGGVKEERFGGVGGGGGKGGGGGGRGALGILDERVARHRAFLRPARTHERGPLLKPTSARGFTSRMAARYIIGVTPLPTFKPSMWSTSRPEHLRPPLYQ